MDRHLRTLLVAVALTLVIAVVSGGQSAHYLMGALFALSLWVMLFFANSAQHGALGASVPWATYAMAAAITTLLGTVFYVVGDENGAWWGPAVILAGTLVWPRRTSAAGSGSGSE